MYLKSRENDSIKPVKTLWQYLIAVIRKDRRLLDIEITDNGKLMQKS